MKCNRIGNKRKSLKLIYKVSEKYLRKVPQFIFNKTAFFTPGNLTKKMNS